MQGISINREFTRLQHNIRNLVRSKINTDGWSQFDNLIADSHMDFDA